MYSFVVLHKKDKRRIEVKKVLIIGMTSGVGGVETFITNVVDKIDRTKFQIDILLFQEPNKKYEKLLTKANKIVRVHAINKKPVRYFIDIMRLYLKEDYDVIHLNECSSKLFVYCWPILFSNNSKLIVHSHNSNDGSIKLHKILAKIQNIVADKMVACSNEAAVWMFGEATVTSGKVQFIKNGIDLNVYKFEKNMRNMYRKKYNLEGKTVLGSVARFERQKNHRRIIDIFEKYHEKNKNSVLVLLGEGSKKSEIEKYVSKKSLKQNVLFLGNRVDVVNWLSTFDVLLMPSLYEGLPFIALEAQACSLPVITSKEISDEVNITALVDSIPLENSNDVWVKKIDNVLLNEDVRLDLRNKIKNDFKKKGYSLGDTVDVIEEEYENLSNKK